MRVIAPPSTDHTSGLPFQPVSVRPSKNDVQPSCSAKSSGSGGTKMAGMRGAAGGVAGGRR